MNEASLGRLRDWTEPAHPSVIRLYDDLIGLYRTLRERQREIDDAFDRVSAQIGYVVTTTLPVRIDVSDGHIKSAMLDNGALEGTLFKESFSGVLERLSGHPMKQVADGTYRLHIIWYTALKLKLRRDWTEPAHVLKGLIDVVINRIPQAVSPGKMVMPDIPEPAHWFDPGVMIALEDAVVIAAIDEVYPQLKLAERIAADRVIVRRIRPEVMEPAHPFGSDMFKQRDILQQLRALVDRYRF